MFITFEGIEGCGKTTQWNKTAEWLLKHGHKVTQTREPGGTQIGDLIRQILLSQEFHAMDQFCELLLYQAARAQHLSQIIRPALARSEVVVCDRYIDSTFAYQGGGRGRDKAVINQLDDWISDGLKPDLTFLVDLDPEEGLKRSKKRLSSKGLLDKEGRFEMEELVFHQKVRAAFLERAQSEPERIKVIDGKQTIDGIFKDVIQILEKKI